MTRIISIVLVLAGCDNGKVDFTDNKKIVDYCTRQTDCQMEDYWDDAYDFEDEDAWIQLQNDLCVDEYYDQLEVAGLFDCQDEYKAYQVCAAEHSPLSCDYDMTDDDDVEDYQEDRDTYESEDCWQEIRAYYQCW